MAAKIENHSDLVIFGGTGDLALRKLIPALYYLYKDHRLPKQFRVIGVSRRGLSDEEYRQSLTKDASIHISKKEFEESLWQEFVQCCTYQAVDALQLDTFEPLKMQLAEKPSGIRVFYLATLPGLYGTLCHHLKDSELVTDTTRVVVEKPIGQDLASAQAINEQLAEVFHEDQVFRIDHYLGKETVQNLMALRFANAMFEPLWKSSLIEHVQISVMETVGVDSRGGYYDKAGAMRDMLQNHLLQLLCLVAMEPPVQFEQSAVRNEKQKVLHSLRPIVGADVQSKTVRAQYVASTVADKPVTGYLQETGVGEDSQTETYVAIRANIDNWRWAGVPFYLRTGKRVAQQFTEIVVQFKPVPHHVFSTPGAELENNRLVIRIQPDEQITLRLMSKTPGRGMQLHPVDLTIDLGGATNRRRWDAYERLLLDVIEGDSTLFMRRDEIEAAWAWVDPIIAAWQQFYSKPKNYTAGSWGPKQANSLIERDGYSWHDVS